MLTVFEVVERRAQSVGWSLETAASLRSSSMSTWSRICGLELESRYQTLSIRSTPLNTTVALAIVTTLVALVWRAKLIPISVPT